MSKKKKIILTTIIGSLVILILVMIELKPINIRMREVVVSNWNGKNERYVITKINYGDDVNTNFTECYTTFRTALTMDEIVEINDDYIGEIEYYSTPLKYDARLFFNGSNYYVIYYEDETDLYYAECCCITIRYGEKPVYVPMPIDMVIMDDIIELYKESGDNILDYLFDNYTFEELCEFYERYPDEYVSIDRENKSISVAGYIVKYKKVEEDYLCINFENRTFSFRTQDGNGELITIDGMR